MKPDPRQWEARLRRATTIPTLPTIATAVTQLVRDPHASVAEVSKLIGDDQALTATILRVVNSAYYGFPNEIQTVHHAIVILGFSKVRSVVFSASIIPKLNPPDPGGFEIPQLWQHSMTVAIASEVIARAVRPTAADDAFVGGLLHDIGKVILAAFFQDEFRHVLAKSRSNECLFAEAETEVLGCHHGLYGKWLAERWGFPARLVDAIHFHHAPMASRHHADLAAVVHLGDIVARAIGIGSGGDAYLPAVQEDVWDALRLTPKDLDAIVPDIYDAIRRARAFYDLIQRETAA